jgi:hypothetical protein
VLQLTALNLILPNVSTRAKHRKRVARQLSDVRHSTVAPLYVPCFSLAAALRNIRLRVRPATIRSIGSLPGVGLGLRTSNDINEKGLSYAYLYFSFPKGDSVWDPDQDSMVSPTLKIWV